MGSIEEIEPGDVVLMRSRTALSAAVRLLDGAEVDFAALALEDGMVGEVVGVGPRRFPLAKAVAAHEDTIILRAVRPVDPTPVLHAAKGYIDAAAPFVQQQLVLVALLTLTRPLPPAPSRRRLVRAVLDHTTATLHSVVAHGRQLMLCPEFVAHCHREAGETYRLHADPARRRATGSTLLDWALAQPALSAAGSVPVAAEPTDPATAHREAATTLAPLISHYLIESGLTTGSVGVSTAAAGEGMVTDEDLLRSMVSFGTALAPATGRQEEGGDASRAALGMIHTLAADPHFVTPGDIHRNSALREVTRIQGPTERSRRSP
ncbi:hypothetical protein GCM10012275_34590 [Longimycelium tulufanense]|uniref:Uncharacterized protein n=1 Tax=Longimycelium tulufanense TaxID=907463 RepID=A0A8J3CH61_9PSEU|nr:hypothetical protein [Longimycelium tulufanense]GGM60608.1 hypothetical protein GCM10012275_34590 [Longimycelium tulufanense]